MGKGAKADTSNQPEALTPLVAFEQNFTKQMGTSEKCCWCMTLGTGVQIIGVLVILNAFNHVMTFFQRSGAPCFFWWKNVASIITVVMGMALRWAAVPSAVMAVTGARNAEDKGPRFFFYCLLGLMFFQFLDLFLCLFEVHAVCAGGGLRDWNSCAHDWGKNQYHCIAIDATDIATVAACAAVEQVENDGITGEGGLDWTRCDVTAGCQHVEMLEDDWVTPECCVHEDWAHDKGPCGRAPQERKAEFDVANREFISDVYDVGLGIVWALILLLCAYAVNSYREALTVTPTNPMKCASVDPTEFVNPTNEDLDEE